MKSTNNNTIQYKTFEDIENSAEKMSFIQTHPAIAAIAAAALIGAPVAGIGISNMVSGAAELEPAAEADTVDVQAEYKNLGGEVSTTTTTTQEKAKKDVATSKFVGFSADGPGHIEPVDNCDIDGVASTITIKDASKNAAFKLVKDVDGAKGAVDINGEHIENVEMVLLEANKAYTELRVTFTAADADPVSEAPASEVAADAEPAPVFEAAPIYFDEPVAEFVGEPVYEEPVYYEEPAPVYEAPAEPVAEPVVNTPNVTSETFYYYTDKNGTHMLSGAPNINEPSGQVPHSMNGEEMGVARDIFNEYNAYRARCGLPTVAWSDDCANMAYASATGCARINGLTHRLGIPGQVQHVYSDILQYSSWKMTGAEAVDKWYHSTGHRKMMQCDSSTSAGVGVFKNSDGKWYYAIVYNFAGSNQSGN